MHTINARWCINVLIHTIYIAYEKRAMTMTRISLFIFTLKVLNAVIEVFTSKKLADAS